MTMMSAFSKSQQWLLAVATMRGVRQVHRSEFEKMNW